VLKMRALFVVAAVALAAFASVDLDFDGDVNLTNADGDFSFRFIGTGTFNLMGYVKLLGWTSLSVDASTASSEAKANGNAMVGLGLLPSTHNPPISILAYGSGTAAVDVSLDSFTDSLISLSPSLDANFAGGVVAMAALDMRECDPDNKTVGNIVLLDTDSLLKCIPHSVEGDEDNLVGYYCSYSPVGTDADVTVTFITSKRAGILEYGNTPVSPRTFEMVIEVSDFPLKDKKNHVRMDFGLLTAKGAGSLEGSATFVHRPGKEDIYVGASKHAVIDGKPGNVDVSFEVGSADMDNFAKGVLNMALGKDFDVQIAHVDFPAGATDFVYDPVVGAGKDIYQAAEGASTIALSALVALVCALLYLF